MALSGEAEDIGKTAARLKEVCPDDPSLCIAGSTWPTSGFASKACRRGPVGWGSTDRVKAGLAINEMVATAS